MALLNTSHYTINDIYALPEGQRAELIDGQIYYMRLLMQDIRRLFFLCHVKLLTILIKITEPAKYILLLMLYF